MLLKGFLKHLQARNFSPRTIKAAEEYLRPFLRKYDPLIADRYQIEGYLADMATRCRPSTVATAWRHLAAFFAWLTEEEIDVNPMEHILKPIVPPVEIKIPTVPQLQALLKSCSGRDPVARRDYAILAVLLDTGLRLSEMTRLSTSDVSDDFSIRVLGKGRKWRLVTLGDHSSQALSRWLRVRKDESDSLWTGKRGPLTPTGIRRIIQKRGAAVGLHLHPHMLRHSFVDNWLRNGGSEIDLARLCGWTSTRMAERYAQYRAQERALSSHRIIGPLDRLY